MIYLHVKVRFQIKHNWTSNNGHQLGCISFRRLSEWTEACTQLGEETEWNYLLAKICHFRATASWRFKETATTKLNVSWFWWFPYFQQLYSLCCSCTATPHNSCVLAFLCCLQLANKNCFLERVPVEWNHLFQLLLHFCLQIDKSPGNKQRFRGGYFIAILLHIFHIMHRYLQATKESIGTASRCHSNFQFEHTHKKRPTIIFLALQNTTSHTTTLTVLVANKKRWKKRNSQCVCVDYGLAYGWTERIMLFSHFMIFTLPFRLFSFDSSAICDCGGSTNKCCFSSRLSSAPHKFLVRLIFRVCTRHPPSHKYHHIIPFHCCFASTPICCPLALATHRCFFFTFILAAWLLDPLYFNFNSFFSLNFVHIFFCSSWVLSLYFRCANTECVSVTNVHGQNHHIHLNNVLVFHQIWVLSCRCFFSAIAGPSVTSGHVYLSVQYIFFCRAVQWFFCTSLHSIIRQRQSQCSHTLGQIKNYHW